MLKDFINISRSKVDTARLPIKIAPIPRVVQISLTSSTGVTSQCIVNCGQRVEEGEVIALAVGAGTRNVHASIPGVVRNIKKIKISPSFSSLVVEIELNGKFRFTGVSSDNYKENYNYDEPKNLREKLENVGISPVWQGINPKILMLLIMDQGSYITSNQRIFIEQVDQIKMGINVICKAFELDEVIFIVQKQNRNTVFLDVLSQFGIRYLKLDLTQAINARYSLQAVKNLSIKNSIPTKQISVWDPENLSLAFGALFGIPSLYQIITITGNSIRRPQNYKFRIGTSIETCLEESGGVNKIESRVFSSNGSAAYEITDFTTPITKETSCLVANKDLREDTINTNPCIKCGLCIEVCPVNLDPQHLHELLYHGNIKNSLESGLQECIECGYCSIACPSHIKLVQDLSMGKSIRF